MEESKHRLAVVAGTSSCHLVQSPQGVFVPGVWGPYKDAVFPGWWMNEGGQSSTGQVCQFRFNLILLPHLYSMAMANRISQLIDFMITTHPAYTQLVQRAEKQSTSIHSGGLICIMIHQCLAHGAWLFSPCRSVGKTPHRGRRGKPDRAYQRYALLS